MGFVNPKPEPSEDPMGKVLSRDKKNPTMAYLLFTGYKNKTYSFSPLYYSPEPDSPHDFDSLYLGLDNGTIAEISHQPSSFIKNCTVEGIVTEQCKVLMSRGGHRRFLGSTFGLCYTYNFQDVASNMDLDTVRRSGEYAGLELLVDTEGSFLKLRDRISRKNI